MRISDWSSDVCSSDLRPGSHRALALDHQHARLAERAGDVLVARAGHEQVRPPEPGRLLAPGLAPVHLDDAVEHHEQLVTVVDVPAIRQVGPVQPPAGTLDLEELACAPSPTGGEAAGGGDNDGDHQ